LVRIARNLSNSQIEIRSGKRESEFLGVGDVCIVEAARTGLKKISSPTAKCMGNLYF